MLGVVIERISQNGSRLVDLPCYGDGLFTRISPIVGIVEVEHEHISRILDAFSQFGNIVERLTDTFTESCRIHKDTDTDSVPSLLFEERKWFNDVTQTVFIDGIGIFKLSQP